jgi:hypothetical protein
VYTSFDEDVVRYLNCAIGFFFLFLLVSVDQYSLSVAVSTSSPIVSCTNDPSV